MNTFLVTAAAGDTGSPTVKFLLEKGHKVRALVRREDERAAKLRASGAEVVVADMLQLRQMRQALEGVTAAYFCYPLAEGLVEATAIFAQAAKEAKIKLIVNMSQKQSRPDATSPQTLKHWIAEQVLDWSGIPTAHLRVTLFAEWLLYSAHLIRGGRYVTPFDPDSRFAPIAAADIARVVASMLIEPGKHVGKIYSLHGPVEYSHAEIAQVLADTLGKDIQFEHVSVDEFLTQLGIPENDFLRLHFLAIKQDQRERLLEGLDEVGIEIIGQPLTTLPQFIEQHYDLLAS
ncbi:NmrA family NAD(P)-binding protein [Cedecea neteri]|uniref:NmrA family transcriptional regulator n=1 Tax=Cedecea neteri TaxID=158822 RepID=A0AAN0S8E6_9ENTR|nr:NmrA family NAD(P)-binding protein [Cedecea neteri]AIR63331.1 NmrA family transcriptional regulator [Cedecea neteri]NIG76116.1 NmrA family NAD(P)-binding protein [Klebsiella sp. Ap-873]WNJ80824.1 NmrA family NAD(P)-binding protein [Cedecea neteri]